MTTQWMTKPELGSAVSGKDGGYFLAPIIYCEFSLPKLGFFLLSPYFVLYVVLFYPFLTYGLISWGNTYSSTNQPLFILQKRTIRIMTFSKFHEHSSPIFKRLNIVKLPDVVTLYAQISQ